MIFEWIQVHDIPWRSVDVDYMKESPACVKTQLQRTTLYSNWRKSYHWRKLELNFTCQTTNAHRERPRGRLDKEEEDVR